MPDKAAYGVSIGAPCHCGGAAASSRRNHGRNWRYQSIRWETVGEVTKPTFFMGQKAQAHARLTEGYETTYKHGFNSKNGLLVVRAKPLLMSDLRGAPCCIVGTINTALHEHNPAFVEIGDAVDDAGYDLVVAACENAGVPLLVYKEKK